MSNFFFNIGNIYTYIHGIDFMRNGSARESYMTKLIIATKTCDLKR